MKTPIINNDASAEVVIIRLLQEVGVPANLKGYLYIRTAVGILLEDPSKIETGSVTKYVYPKVAEEHGTTAQRVERAIRHAIERSSDNYGVSELMEKMGQCASISKGKLTNSEFLAILAEDARIELGAYGSH